MKTNTYKFLSNLMLFVLLLPPLYGQTKNGFDLKDSLISVEKILPGGPPKDGIPAIDNPKFKPAKDLIKSFSKDERVIQVTYKEQTKLYPISILNWHEIVNDSIAGKKITVTFCPLCGTGVVFETPSPIKEFGVSGLLYESDVLLYDRQTLSLWSQILRKAVTGPLKGKSLKVFPATHLPLAEAYKKHPDALLLAHPQIKGQNVRNYQQNPYEGYDQNQMTYFPTSINLKNAKAPLKAWSLLVDDGETQIIYILRPKSQSTGKKSVKIGKQEIEISFNAKNRQISCAPHPKIECLTGYYFAFHSFYPKAKLEFLSP